MNSDTRSEASGAEGRRPAAAVRRGRWLGRLALVAAPFALLLGAELILRLVDPAPEDPRWKDPYLRPLRTAGGEAVLDEAGRALLSNEPAMADWVGKNAGRRAFPATAAPGVLRIFSLGASTTYGLKYAPHASYSRFLEARLRERLQRSGGAEVEVVNLGISGYDSVDLPRLVDELMDHDPDVLLLYAGHNELKYPNLARVRQPLSTAVAQWLRRSALLWRWLQDPPAPAVPPELCSEPLLQPEDFQRALEGYSRALRRIVEEASRRGVRVFLCTPASNVRDKLPRQSELPAEAEAELSARFAALKQRLGPGAPAVEDGERASLREQTEELCRRAPEASLAYFLRARARLLEGDDVGAAADFARSRALDRLPERAWPALVDRVRTIAAESGAELVDVEARLAREAEHGIPGSELFFDYCHPNLRGHWLIADEILAAMRRAELFGVGKLEPAAEDAGFEQWCERFGVDESMGTTQRAREILGTAAAREGEERERLLLVVEEFLGAILADPASTDAVRAEAHTLGAIVAVMRGDEPACREALREARSRDLAVRRGLLQLMARNAFFRDRFAALGIVVGPDGSIEGELP